jgi:plasmid stabilization system protein ParE
MSVVDLRFAESALGDLRAIQDWYLEQGVPAVGNRLVGEIFDLVESLSEHPRIGRVVPEFELDWLRELIHPPFRIVYRLDEPIVRVLRVWRSERLLRLPANALSREDDG